MDFKPETQRLKYGTFSMIILTKHLHLSLYPSAMQLTDIFL